ncbi:MAG TPA: AAA family ATPase [Solirubrobacteraceae bacterium]
MGRDDELALVERFLTEAAGGPAGLLIEGDAGIGKTTIWRVAVRFAAEGGWRVLAAHGTGTEVRLAYAGLADLLVDVEDDVLDKIPAPQRAALGAALLRDFGGANHAPDPRAVATGLLSTLELLAGERPLLVAIDDLQWLDASTMDALRFAVRRIGGPIGVLAASRPSDGEAALESNLQLREASRLARVSVVPLRDEQIERMLVAETERALTADTDRALATDTDRVLATDTDRVLTADTDRALTADTDRVLTAPLLARIVEIAGGNPFVALELAQTLKRDAFKQPIALPASLRELVDARLSALEPDVRETVLYAAMLARPDVGQVQRALGERDAEALLGDAELAGIVTLDGARILFSHPLLATGAYSSLSAPERRDAHRRIASVTAGEERARHLGLSSVTAEPAVIAALDSAAAEARAQGSAAAAAELLELALRLGAEDPPRRQLAAEHHLDSGDVGRARELCESLVDELELGSQRALALERLGIVHRLLDDLPGSTALFEQAMHETNDDAHLVVLSLELAFARTQNGLLAEAVPLAEEAVAIAKGLDDPGLLAQALAVRVVTRFLVGDGADEQMLARALELEDAEGDGTTMLRPSLIAALIYMWIGRLDEAEAAFSRALQLSRDRGEESDLVILTMHWGWLACLRGDVAGGQRMVEETLRLAERLGSPASRAVASENQLVVAGWIGDVETARRAAAAAIENYESVRSPVGSMHTHASLGILELSLGCYAAAADCLLAATNITLGMRGGDPGSVYWAADAVEALAAVDRLDEAEQIRAWQRERSDAIGRPNLLAIAARVDAVVLMARGKLPEAEALLEQALAHHQHDPVQYQLARTLLTLGQVRRRRRRRAAARDSLEQAQQRFAALGAQLWAQRATAELERVDVARAINSVLTAAEERVAALAATGLTNRAAAAELFVSPKTIEATLARVYRKLGIRSRAELGSWMAERQLR